MSEVLGCVRPFGELFAIPLRNGLNRPTTVRGMGVKMVNMGELFANTHIGNIPMERVPFSEKESLTCLLEKGDLLFARQSLVWEGAGKCSIFLGADEPTTYEGHIIRARLNRNVASPEFYYYYFNSLEGRQNVETIIQQVAAAGIRGSDLERLDVPVPPISEQSAIARILGALDDKIELNGRMNHTLEMMARALFKSWFVDFDPATAKAEGRAPFGMSAETAGLFAAEFVETGNDVFTSIPKGWQLSSLADIANYENGLALQKYRPEGAEILPVIKIRELRQGFANESSEKASPNIKPSCIIDDGDVIFSWSGSLMIDLWCGGKGALNQHLFKVTSEKYPKWFYYFWTYYHLTDFQNIAAGKATTMGHIQRHHLATAKVIVPPDDILARADKLVRPMMDSIVKNRVQSRTLASIRDALLPRLLSGEVRVKV